MAEHRALSKKNKWYVPKESFLTVIHYCRQYPEWEAELAALTDTSKGIAYDSDRVQSSGDSDPTADLAIRRAGISHKKDVIDHVAYRIGGELFQKWLILGICHGYPFHYMQTRGIPCGKKYYYEMRRRFIYEMSELISTPKKVG